MPLSGFNAELYFMLYYSVQVYKGYNKIHSHNTAQTSTIDNSKVVLNYWPKMYQFQKLWIWILIGGDCNLCQFRGKLCTTFTESKFRSS